MVGRLMVMIALLSSSDYESVKANLALNLGARFEYKLDEHSVFSVQPAFNYPLLVTAKDDFVQFTECINSEYR